jgi:hypothetical protein
MAWRGWWVVGVLACVVCVACDGGGTAPAEDGGLDGSLSGDSGSPEDAATRPDGAPPLPDGSAPDGGGSDGGEPIDGGPALVDGGPLPGCGSNADCASTEYCLLPAGTCSGRGTCVTRPDVCLPVIMEVCGCDGRTYGNDCEAQVAGVNVASMGACGSGLCELRPSPPCCFMDSQCRGIERCAGATCTEGGEGTCVTTSLLPGQCWDDSDCTDDAACEGANRCPCGAACLVPDRPGRCGAPTP